jgi:GTPase
VETRDTARTLSDGVVARDPRAIARAISIVEAGSPEAGTLLGRLYPRTGRALVVGVTGAPGAGKSTLVDRLTTLLRRQGRTVGIVAVDPTSPFSGGAILGDRVRMQTHALDPGVFIRSMATRGRLGGLAAATGRVLSILDAAGKDVVLVETVGVGQDEVDVVGVADVSLVVVVPGLGDEIQALKAGIMEIADVFVVNKADREGVDRIVAEIETVLSLAPPGAVRPAIVKTVASEGRGAEDVLAAIETFRGEATRSGALVDKRRSQAGARFREELELRLASLARARVLTPEETGRIVDRLVARETDPWTAVDEVVGRMGLA